MLNDKAIADKEKHKVIEYHYSKLEKLAKLLSKDRDNSKLNSLRQSILNRIAYLENTPTNEINYTVKELNRTL